MEANEHRQRNGDRMAGKRPDQYRITNDEGGATDYKTYPNEPREVDVERELYGRIMKGQARRQQPIPPKLPEPETEEKRDDELERQAHIHEDNAEGPEEAED